MSKIAFIGLGAMGLPMARNLLAKGHEVIGFDLRREPVDMLVSWGGRSARSPAEAASGADVLMLMVVDAGQAQSVLFDDAALHALPPGGIVVLTATCPPLAVTNLASRVEAEGRRFADAPVSGGTAGAAAGSLTVMFAGSDELFQSVRPILLGIGQKIFHVGIHSGQGAAMKIANQLLCGVHIAACAEVLSLAGVMRLDLKTVLEILGGSAASSWMLNDRGPRMLEQTPDVSSAVDIFVKDLGIVMEVGRDVKSALPLAAFAHQLFVSTSGRGDGALDDSQVIRAYHLLNGKLISR